MSLRAKALTILFLFVNATLWFNQFVNHIALKQITWRYYVFYCVWLLIECVVVYYFYIETRYTPLEQIAKHFDGEDAVAGRAVATYHAKALAAEVGGLDNAEVGEKEGHVEQREL